MRSYNFQLILKYDKNVIDWVILYFHKIRWNLTYPPLEKDYSSIEPIKEESFTNNNKKENLDIPEFSVAVNLLLFSGMKDASNNAIIVRREPNKNGGPLMNWKGKIH